MTDPLLTTKTVPPADPLPGRRGVSVPSWLAVLIVVLVAGGFAYLGWRMLRPPPPVDLSQYDANETGGGRFAFPGGLTADRPPGTARPEPVEGVTLQPDGSGTARTLAFNVRFTGGKKPNVIAMARTAGAAPADRAAARALTLAVSDADVRKAAAVTDDQLKRLRAIPAANRNALITPDTRKRLLAVWAKLRDADAASKPTAEKAVLDAVRAAGADFKVTDAAAIHATAEQVRAVLTPEQIAKVRPRVPSAGMAGRG